ncbi:MAG: hypothetical protein V1704_02400 [Candidatus Vogelbacteria bacterium]
MINVRAIIEEQVEKERAGSRQKQNEELAVYLSTADDDFKNDIKKVRDKYNISNFTAEEARLDDYDENVIFDINNEPYGIPTSKFLNEKLTEKERAKFKKDIDGIIKKYSLPLNFYDWMEWCVLYNHEVPWQSLFNWELFSQIIENPKELERVGLTTREKHEMKKQWRDLFNMKIGRPSKKQVQQYGEFLKLLSKSKNKKRRMRTFLPALKALKMRQGKEKYSEWGDFGTISTTKKYKDKVAEIYPDLEGEDDDRLAVNLRKQKERLLKRFKIKGKK